MTILETAVAGGLAGMLCWFVSYPQDILKTKLQLFDIPSKKIDGGWADCAKSIYK